MTMINLKAYIDRLVQEKCALAIELHVSIHTSISFSDPQHCLLYFVEQKCVEMPKYWVMKQWCVSYA